MNHLKIVSGSTIKIIALISMLLDHIGATIVGPMMEKLVFKGGFQAMTPEEISLYSRLLTLNEVLRSVGRIAFLLFCFLLVEGFTHTRDKGKYLLRLALFAIISEIPFDLAVSGNVLEYSHQNVFFTLAIAFGVMMAYEFILKVALEKKLLWIGAALGAVGYVFLWKEFVLHGIEELNLDFAWLVQIPVTNTLEYGVIAAGIFLLVILAVVFWRKKKLYQMERFLLILGISAAGFYLAEYLRTDYAGYGVIAVAVIYWLRKKRVLSAFGGYLALCFMSLVEMHAIFGLIPIALYNGQRGWKLKYIFYIFYPGHLLLLYIIRMYMG